MSLRRLLVSHLGPYRNLLAVVIVLQAIQTAAALTLPTLNADIIDNGVLVGDNAYIWRVGAIMLFFSLVQIAFAIGAVRYGARAAMSFGRDLRRDIFHQVNSYSAREVGQFGAPSLITRITNDVQQVQMLVVLACTMMIAAPITMVFGIIFAVREDAGLSVIMLVVIPILVGVLAVIISRMIPTFQVMQLRVDRVNQVLRDQITGIRVVRAFVREPEEVERFAGANDDLTAASLRAGRLMALMFPTVTLFISMSNVAVLWLGAARIDSGDMELGSVVAYLSYLVQVLMAVVMLTFMISMIPRAAVASERIDEVLQTDSSVVPPENPVTEVSEHGTVDFNRVGFTYPGAAVPVLSDISFTVRPGRTTAIIGSTGSGKSTLVDLVPRLFDATEGSVVVNGVDVRQLDPDLLWGSIGYVPQKPYLFSGTVASNLRFGRPEATEEELWQALEVAQAAGFVQSMPDGLESPITQGGTNVSGGQRQRLSIARALVLQPDIYVFDDSFSALDLATDARLRLALKPHVQAAGVLIVAQRVSTIADADQIIVVDNGRVVGRGRHVDLIDTCPTYAEIVDSQFDREPA
ncbi:ABC transporter ATP-binding protein [Ilumatobacter nonamiensis]|uniref:ABC transporter ATP-binding protein n=1 Tax=Ilumatobacter nonamiensis TaxID=467093 RepID=UPI0003454B6E|nr:ABC transporter ATP-binding protein [Ilumatobacter nonamiensis]